jgi:ethanolamine-phosphate cytidylyltransferase
MAEDGASRPSRGYIDGCFDIMHSGHYNAIRQAKMICDVLVVGVHSDPEIAENKALPVMRQDERYALLEHIKWIDEIVHDVPYSPLLSTLDLAKADFCVHGDDMPVNAQGICAYDEMRDAGKLRIVKRTEGVSTTDLIGRLLTLARPENREPTGQPRTPVVMKKVSPGEFMEVAFKDSAKTELEAQVEETFARISKKYSMADEDLREMQRALAMVARPPRSPGPMGITVSGEKEEEMRTKAPVQLLASTRRITEFSSARQPTEEDRVVYVSGAFDMFNVGHAQFLKEAKEKGTFLCVGIQDDVTVMKTKGACFPIMNLNERVLNVCACKWVDEVVIGAPRQVTEDLIKTWDIKVVAQGVGHQRTTSLAAEDTSRNEIPKKLGLFVEIQSKWPHLCHDTVVDRITKDREVYLNRNKDRARREDQYYNQKGASNSPQEG